MNGRKTIGLGLMMMAVPLVAYAGGWKKYDAPSYGFEMLVPTTTKIKEAELDGWGYLHGTVEGVQLYALANKDCDCTLQEAEDFAEKVVGLGKWKKIDEGQGENGFKSYRTYQTNSKGKLIYGGVGLAANGNAYAFVLVTTPKDYTANKADYMKWYHSCKAK